MLIFEIARNYFRWLPWIECLPLGGKKNLSAGWLCFAVRYYPHDMFDFGTLLKSPDSHWKD